MVATFGVIGLGRMGYRTVVAGRDAGLKLVSVLDSSPAPWGVEQDPKLADYLMTDSSLFWDKKPDIVAISTTADSHFDLFKAAISANIKHILVEKPVACSVNEGLEMERLAEEAGAHVLVNHNHRAWDVLVRLRAFNSSPRFGELKAFIVTQGAGGLGNLGTHYFDLANWLFSDTPISVAGFGTTPPSPNPRGAQFDDHGGVAIVKYPGDRRMVLEIGDDCGVIGGYELRYERARIVMPFVSEPPRVYVRQDEFLNHPNHFYGAPLEELPFGEFKATDVIMNTKCIFDDLKQGQKSSGATLGEAAVALETMIAVRLAISGQKNLLLPLSSTDRAQRFSLA